MLKGFHGSSSAALTLVQTSAITLKHPLTLRRGVYHAGPARLAKTCCDLHTFVRQCAYEVAEEMSISETMLPDCVFNGD